ncbi:hypothetical protein OS493_034498 [Desmophyllum pertusum]|uniref:Uncharacterized protein n=1 Tax=Desmophyllum pertusum TaxID=174260 RepID=A0A9W9YV83_9CNID|nr:hypothetical protein OS493_034498 [Desmophyllum pertusum]
MSNLTCSGSPNFRIDVIFNSLRELQQEKERLQQHCAEEKARCKNLEIKLEACQTKYYQNSEKHCKMLETVNAAKQKVLQTQIQASRLKELNDGKGARIAELRRQIDEETKRGEIEQQIFENKLEELTSSFRNARNYYTEENVRMEMEEWSKQADDAKAEVSKEDNALQELSAKFHQLEMENKKAKDELDCKLEFDVSVKKLQSTLKVFEEMNQESKEKLEISEKQLELELERIKQAKNDCERRDVIPLCSNEQITSNEPEITDSNAAMQPSTSPFISAAESFPQIECNLTEGYRQPTTDNRQYCRLDSPSVTPGSKEGTAHQAHLQSEGRKSSLQARSFFISLPVSTSNN